MSDPTPTIGRIVHYTGSMADADGNLIAGPCRAAIVTEVYTLETCGLTVFQPTGTHCLHAHHDELKAPATWHWPERV